MKIRPATPDDLNALFDLNKQINELHHLHAPQAFVAPSEEDRTFLINMLADEERLFLVAEEGQQVLGFITATITQNETISFLIKDPICRIGTIVVDENQKSKGVGRALMATVEQWARESGAIQVRLEVMEFNRDAQQFYDRLGFIPNSRLMMKCL
ncbi:MULTISPECIES: GNAT family N-acetyltransferase [Vibrio]|uniref:GNAT family N-acetyltransferase n=1 Tax=Vibrio rotiferianus TaxID=190895 RepID=A0ABX3DAZ0_9VIBR|nr:MULTISPECIES: GNAT family N-acetyltransferase [Vibrio]ARR46936.1 GNAT family N-acetyltransferase [Vibrio campbellii]MCE7732798.1 GNAT family N-acetyltransferase [Vibrio campbellii]NDJ83490.1 GNAT family N-acetyltransferase [Vibrio sp. LB10LO1]NOH66865.1 GNAT family N-acetyltransferase [Vibrio rotiferianus]OHY94672.1 GNAT family N-acetyltransferase [Vibrio rotiferianus]